MVEIGLSTNVLLLIILSALTLISYMIAINSHGAARMSLSYLLATILLAITIFAILQDINSRVVLKQQEIYDQKVIEAEQTGAASGRKDAQDQQNAQVAATQKELKAQKASEAKRVTPYINRGQKLASQLKGVQLQAYGKSYDQLTSKASASLSSVKREKSRFNKVSIEHYTKAQLYMQQAYDKLNTSARYYTLFYRADNNRQEIEREKILRRSAAEAATLFRKAQDELAQ